MAVFHQIQMRLNKPGSILLFQNLRHYVLVLQVQNHPMFWYWIVNPKETMKEKSGNYCSRIIRFICLAVGWGFVWIQKLKYHFFSYVPKKRLESIFEFSSLLIKIYFVVIVMDNTWHRSFSSNGFDIWTKLCPGSKYFTVYRKIIEPWITEYQVGRTWTSRIIWCKLCWQKYNPDQNVQHPVRLNLISLQCWGVHYFLGESIPTADCSLCVKFSFSV